MHTRYLPSFVTSKFIDRKVCQQEQQAFFCLDLRELCEAHFFFSAEITHIQHQVINVDELFNFQLLFIPPFQVGSGIILSSCNKILVLSSGSKNHNQYARRKKNPNKTLSNTKPLAGDNLPFVTNP